MSGHAYTAPAVRARGSAESARWSGAGPAALLAGLCLSGLVLVWVLANLVPGLHTRDAVLLYDFTLLGHAPYAPVAQVLVHLVEPELFILWGLALVAFAIARERPRTALAVVLVMWLAPLTTETLKPLVAHTHQSVDGVHIGPVSWPSGHSTAALTLGLCALLVVPPRWRRLTAIIAALFAGAMGASLLILAWHMPSDILAGYLVAGFWTALAVSALRAAERRWPAKRRPALQRSSL